VKPESLANFTTGKDSNEVKFPYIPLQWEVKYSLFF